MCFFTLWSSSNKSIIIRRRRNKEPNIGPSVVLIGLSLVSLLGTDLVLNAAYSSNDHISGLNSCETSLLYYFGY